MPVEHILVIAMFLTFVAGLFTGFPIAFVLGGVGVLFTGVGYLADLYLGTLTGLDYLMLGMSINRIFKYMDNWVLVALPMFIFMGLMLDRSGIAEKMMHAIQNLFGKVRGGLAVAAALQTSFLTPPPVGFALFYLKGVCPPEVKLSEIYRGVVPLIGLQLAGLAMVAFFPALVTWLPAMAYR